MNFKTILVVLSAVFLSAIAQITLKYGMSRPEMLQIIESASWRRIVYALGTSCGILTGLAIYGASMALWLFVLARVDVGQAYPFVGAGFLVTMAFGHFCLGEPINLYRISGAILVSLGIILVAHQ